MLVHGVFFMIKSKLKYFSWKIMTLFVKKHIWKIIPWFIAIMCILMSIHMGRQYVRVCTHIMNINDGIYLSNATNDAKNRASYLANLCFVNY